MNELIPITTGGQGSPVVSARELHQFLEVRSKFADWIKNRIIRYGFQEETDYIIISEDTDGYSKNLEKGGRPELDYALTLDMAKQLAMVERTAKGKEARLYFIEAEKTLHKVMATPAPTPLSTEQAMLQLMSQQVQLLSDTQQMLTQLRTDVDGIMNGQRPTKPARPGKQLSLPGIQSPVSRRIGGIGGAGLRHTIHQHILDYCNLHQATTQETYHYLYKRMYEVYGVSVYRLLKAQGETLLDAVERYGHLDRLYSLVMAELNYADE